jgi:hypothetical protein
MTAGELETLRLLILGLKAEVSAALERLSSRLVTVEARLGGIEGRLGHVEANLGMRQ